MRSICRQQLFHSLRAKYIYMFRTWLYEYVFVMLFRNKKHMQSKTTTESLPQVPKVNTTDSKSK